MWATALLQNGAWRFDPRSALLGALIAWGIVWILYVQRAALRRKAEQLRAPILRWRSRSQRGTGEKYLAALQVTLRRLLLFSAEDPRVVFIPPTFLAPGPLPATPAEAAETPATQLLRHDSLLHGHSRVVICGLPGTGRTMALAMTVWRIAERDAATRRPFQRFPVWIDLALPGAPPDAKVTPIRYIAELATRFLPQALPKWLMSQLRTQPSLILVDNWDATPPAARQELAQRIAQAAAALPESLWLIAAGPEGHGPLVEAGFTPVQIQPPLDQDTLLQLHEGWSTALGVTEPELRDDALAAMLWAIAAGDTLPELTLRINLHLRCREIPYRPVEVLEALLRNFYLPLSDLEEAPESIAPAQELALTILAQLARIIRLEGRAVAGPQLQELLDRFAPLADKQDKLPASVRKAIQSTPLLERSGRTLQFVHPLWEDFLTAKALAAETAKTNLEPLLLLEHLYDQEWRYLLDCYAGLSDAEPLVKALLREALANAAQPDADRAQEALLLAARWTIRAPEDVPWRSFVTKALMQIFVQPAISPEYRLKLSQALALIAGESAYPFYLQALRHPALPMRAAALRGIGWAGSPKDLKLLAAALKDPHFEIQESALRAINDLGTSGAYRFLAALLPQSGEQLMLLIAEVLAGNPDSWEGLREAVQAEDLLVRRAVAHGLSAVRQPWARELLQQLARDDPQWLVRSAAEAALSAQQPSQTVVAAPPQPDQLQWLMTWAAKQGLGLGLGEAALTVLLHALQSGDSATRVLATRTLSQIGRPEHLPALQALRNEPAPDVQKAARQAARQIEARYRGLPEAAEHTVEEQ